MDACRISCILYAQVRESSTIWKLREERGALDLNFTRKGVDYEHVLDCWLWTNYREYCSDKELGLLHALQPFTQTRVWTSYRSLLFLKNIYNLEDEPNDAKAYEEEGNDASKQCIYGDTKHNVWPIPVLSNR